MQSNSSGSMPGLRAAASAPRGFTLVELLVVIGIIALLMGILLPTLGNVRKHSLTTTCAANMRQIAQAGIMYAQEQGKYVGYAAGIDRKMLLYPYIGQGKDNADVAGNIIWNCPSNDAVDLECGYGFNTNLNWVKLNQVRKWSETVALCDSGVRDGPVQTLSTMCQPPSKTSTSANPAYRPNPRHAGKKVNVAFVDGHVEPMLMDGKFYPGPVGQWSGNGVVDQNSPDYKDELWDLF